MMVILDCFSFLTDLNCMFHAFLPFSVEVADTSDEKPEDMDVRHDFGIDLKTFVVMNHGSNKELEKLVSSDSVVVDTYPSSGNDHTNSVASSADEEVIGTHVAFDVGVNCMEWSLEVENRNSEQTAECMEDGLYDSEGSSLYLAIQQTNALDGSNEKSRQVENVAEEDDLDDFDPYLFIKHLPDLSEVILSSRSPVLLPKQTRRCPPITLVLDLDGNIVFHVC